MSRRPPGAADNASRANSEISRRQVIAGATAAAIVKEIPVRMDRSVGACQAWLAQDHENEALIKRWQQLENFLIHEREWLKLSEEQRADIPEAKEFYIIQERLDALQTTRQDLLEDIPHLPATSLHGLSLKLVVASKVVPIDENEEGHSLIVSCLENLQAMAR